MTRLVVVTVAGWLACGAAYGQGCMGTDIRPLVCSLAPGFVPTPLIGPVPDPAYRSPDCENPDQASQQQKDAVQAAFNLIVNKNPAFLAQAELCSLDHIFIITDPNAHSWGKWENPKYYSDPNWKHTYIALHQDDVINKAIRMVQDGHSASLGIGTGVARHSSPTGDSPSVGLLYVIMHELGHIKWHKEWDKPGGIACFDSNFVPASWASEVQADQDDLTSAKTRRWTSFGNQLGAHRNPTVPPPRHANAALLRKIYTNGFMTALAAANPEEDFVETYSMRTVTKAAQNLDLRINIGGVDHYVTKNRMDLSDKFDCVDPMIGGPALTVRAPYKTPARRR